MYQWDAANRLVSQVNALGDTTTYRYDGDNNRVYMGVDVGSGAAQVSYPNGHPAGARKGWEPQYKKQQLDVHFTNDTTTALPQPLYATDESGTGWKQSYVYGANDERISMSYLPSADESTDWEPVAGESGAAPNRTPETLYYLEDSLDSVLALLNNDDEVALRYHYDAFGVATDSEKFDLNYPGPDNLFGYTGLGYDASSGLSYARARYFDSSIGRFISQDTYEGQLDNPLSLNLYTYVENNPLRYVDPTGHCIAGKDKGCNVDSFSGVDDFNFFSIEIQENSDQWWILQNNVLPACSTQKCIDGVKKQQKRLEELNDAYRNNVCFYVFADGCSSNNTSASFILSDNKAIGIEIQIIEKSSWSFFDRAEASGLPDKMVGSNSLGRIEHYFASGDHGPAHVHVYDSKGNMVRVGQNGKPLKGEPELNSSQQKLVNEYKKQIRNTTTKIMKWYRTNNRPPSRRG